MKKGKPMACDTGHCGPAVSRRMFMKSGTAAAAGGALLALDAEDAALKLEQRLPQLAVIELLISGGTGADLCQRLKEAGVAACLVISTLDARDQALAAGADAFLRKPLDPLQFVSTVKDLLGKSAFLQGAPSL